MANETDEASLARARASQSMMNYETIISGFAAMGVKPEEITPRVNVLTFKAWKACGRTVKKGEHGVRVCTFVQPKAKDVSQPQQGSDEGSAKRRTMPWYTTVFHISQTEALK
jgi:antirestriction protein ArdC